LYRHPPKPSATPDTQPRRVSPDTERKLRAS
jgi:hypothetical protein